VHQVVRHRHAVALALDQDPRPPRRLRVPVPCGDAQLQPTRMPGGLRAWRVRQVDYVQQVVWYRLPVAQPH
jgi:hypothetical protein